MGKKYLINGLALTASVVAIVWSRVFTGSTLAWVIFGIAAAIAAASVVGIRIARERLELTGFAALGLVAAWSAVAALVFTGATLGWLAFADAIGTAIVAAASLVRHELTTERVVHTLEVRETSATRTGEPDYRSVA